MKDFLDHLDREHHAWLYDPGLSRIFNVVAKGGGEARVVGGAVRDALLGHKVDEIDLAVNLLPDITAALLRADGLKTIPTGIEHGTITVVVDHKGYEITTLRRDIETNGRHATVTFTQDWQEDAARRDFTFNALYVNAQGQIYDYFQGRQDLMAGKVRFIGDAEQRIKEDVLRILRFFRFHAWFGQDEPDPAGLTACRTLGMLLPQLSVERVWREIIKLLAAPHPFAIWNTMQQNYILAQILPEADDLEHLEKLIDFEEKYGVKPSPLRRLAALIPPHIEAAQNLAQRLKLSNYESNILRQLASLPKKLQSRFTSDILPTTLYKYGPELTFDVALLLDTTDFGAESELKSVLEACMKWQRPIFPLGGDDLLQLGIKSGPQLGILLRSIENWWVQQNFQPTSIQCLNEARRLLANAS